MHPASFYQSLPDRRVRCTLCPHECIIVPGETGRCDARVNQGGKLYTRSYGILSAISMDPIEKKPLYHFHPGSRIMSIGSLGCNFSCDFCQNCQISQPQADDFSKYPSRSPEDLVKEALLYENNLGLAYTYNEPIIFFEYMLECARLVREYGMKNVMVTNGYISRDALERLLPHMDAFNIDLKSIKEKFYRQRCSARAEPVLETIKRVAASRSHLELTFLMIPGHNDSPEEWEEMIDWVLLHCGKETVLHVSRYFPRYKLQAPSTPRDSIKLFLDMARKKLDHVFPGNLPDLSSSTLCPGCRQIIIDRLAYHTHLTGISEDGSCMHCGHPVQGVFDSQEHEKT